MRMEEGNDLSHSLLHVHFRDPSTLRLPGLPHDRRSWWNDFKQLCWRIFLCTMAVLLIFVIPVLRLIFVKSSDPSQELVFQPLVILLRFLISSISFICLCHIVWKHGTKGILFLTEETQEMEEKHKSIMKTCRIQLIKLFLPLLCAYVAHKLWLYLTVSLKPLPFGFKNKALDTIIIAVALCLSWCFGTGTYLYACTLFGEACVLQETKMKLYSDLLRRGLDIGYYFNAYKTVLKCLKATSRRFRFFLAMTGGISVCGFLASLYEIVDDVRTGTGILLSGDLMIVNIVNITGWIFCLRSASRIAHLHRRILKSASSMNANATLEAMRNLQPLLINEAAEKDIQNGIRLFSQFQVDWAGRSALVDFLSNNTAGISIYGFVLDRFFVHTSIGALATTTWFVLGRSLT
ncbi:uncharacterized protein LOC116248639 [Nymphaea colorata]|nr:uncharacterized protein LOC116248639 [Nymphaea colorata]